MRSFRFGGGQFGAKFFTKFATKFFTKFSGLFCWDIQSKKTSAKTSSLNSHDSAQQNWRNFREKLHDEVLQGDPARGPSPRLKQPSEPATVVIAKGRNRGETPNAIIA